MISGEPISVKKKKGDSVIGATVNEKGTLVIRAEKVGSDTVLSQIVHMVAEAQRSRAPIQRLADVVAGWFVPSVIAAAVVAFIVWALVGPEPRMTHALLAAVSVLIIACPCALGLATPMSIMVATGKGASFGVLFKDAEAIETMRLVDTLVVDKTGTLTEGKPRLTDVITVEEWNEKELLELAAGLEKSSEHPLAEAILAGAEERGAKPSDSEDFQSHTGKGVSGKCAHYAGQRQPSRNRQGENSFQSHYAQHQAEPVFCFYLQCTGSSHRSRSPLSGFWSAAFSNDRRRSHEFQFRIGHR